MKNVEQKKNGANEVVVKETEEPQITEAPSETEEPKVTEPPVVTADSEDEDEFEEDEDMFDNVDMIFLDSVKASSELIDGTSDCRAKYICDENKKTAWSDSSTHPVVIYS